ncbi:MAG: FeoB small GTPase domain-containing protein, partial [Alphaproteobacteria bacterium]|nr:FeoB small GTPase domain-containing protein [Alphaproteobacteria bacterium]
AEVVVLVLDAAAPMERQDLNIASRTLDEGRALVIALNKWDAVKDQKAALTTLDGVLEKSLQQVKGVPVVPISARTGFGLDRLMEAVLRIHQLWNKRVPTHKLNEFLRAVVEAHPTPMASNGRRVPMKYMTQVNARPPTFVIFTSNPDQLPDSYVRYLTNGIRDKFGMMGVPMRIHLRKRSNPFAGKAAARPRKNKP